MQIEVPSFFLISANLLDKDNDLRCRVNKRANLIFGVENTPEKQAYIENEFKKRQTKRKRIPSSVVEGNEAAEMYAAIINNPEFANVLMSLLAQHGVDTGDGENSTTQFVELLKNNPQFLQAFLPPKETVQEAPNEPVEEPNTQASILLPTPLQRQTQPIRTRPRPSQKRAAAAKVRPLRFAPGPAPIPSTGSLTEAPAASQPSTLSNQFPIPPPAYQPQGKLGFQGGIRPSGDRVQAFGFPPLMGQPSK